MFLALRELKRSKMRYTLLSLIMIAILFLVFFITGLANGLSFADSSSLQNLSTQYAIVNEEAEGQIINSELTDDQAAQIDAMVNQPSSRIDMTFAKLAVEQEKGIDVIYFSVDTDRYPELKSTEGKNISQLTANEVIVNDSLKKEGFKLGDEIVDEQSGKTMTIAGFIRDHTYSFAPVVYADLSLGLNKIFDDKGSYNAVVYTGPKVAIDGYETLTKDELVQAMPGYSETQGTFTIMKVFLFFIAAFVSAVFFYVITLQKTNQFGVLKAIGATTNYIARTIIVQVLLLTGIGLLFSIAAIAGMVQVLPDGVPLKISPDLIVGAAVIFVILNLIGSLLSVYKVSKIDALEAIGRVE